MLRKIAIGIFFLLLLLFPNPVFASEEQILTECSNRFLTLINPVRSRQLWVDKTLQPIQNQYNIIVGNNFPATWLLQDDVLFDADLVSKLKSFDNQQEFGLLLEISDQLAQNSKVAYPPFVPWYDPKAVFLSGYSQSERRQLIDKMFKDFLLTFGFYPKSVGAWWIDSYSLNYLKEKYGIKSALIVADQRSTDNYGVWGQWWGVPYYPSKANILTPASTPDNKLDVVIIQWAQRDLLFANGEGPKYSNFSLQANDYISLGKSTDYFKNLVSTYLNCRNLLGQVTVGLETGIESVRFLSEYNNQLAALQEINELQAVTMKDFSDQYAKVYPLFPQEVMLGDVATVWELNTKNRINSTLGDLIYYNSDRSFPDYFVADKSSFLDRNLLTLRTDQKSIFWFPWYLFLCVAFGIAACFLKKIRLYVVTILFIIVTYGLVLRSYIQYGWIIYYGAVFKNIGLVQVGLVVFSFILIWLIEKWSKKTWLRHSLFLFLIPLSFGVDIILESVRYTLISGRYYFGIMIDVFRMVGLSFKPPSNLTFINQDFPSIQASALLRLDFERIWNNIWLATMVFPLVHILLAIVIGVVFLFIPKYIRNVLIISLIILFVLQVINIFMANPRAVISIN